MTIHDEFVELDSAVVRFCGDSGDGMQLTGSQFTDTSAISGNDVTTFPDFPAEIRAPAGTIGGVSGFQVNFSSQPVKTAGDHPDALVAMNPAALKKNLEDLRKGHVGDRRAVRRRGADRADRNVADGHVERLAAVQRDHGV